MARRSLEENVQVEIVQLANEIARIKGVLAVILFGSYARGDYDEGSDVDALCLFGEEKSLHKYSNRIHELSSKRRLLVQIVTLTSDEFLSSRLVSTVLREGKILYACKGFSLEKFASGLLKPFALVTYEIGRLSQPRKVRFIQTLSGRGKGRYTYAGFLRQLDGFRIGRNAVMVPANALERLTQFLEEHGAGYVTRYIWLI